MNSNEPKPVYEGRHLRVVQRGGWEYVTRTKATGVVAVVALHDDGRVVLVEQNRPPVDGPVIELPAGLAGDTDDAESLLAAAQRELEEETGYVARAWRRLPTAFSSPGLTDEAITFFLARGLSRPHAGGGVDGEAIKVHEVQLQDVPVWLAAHGHEPTRTDMKLLAGLYAAAEIIGKNTP
jgi:ADP-ribose pyrophosphatase